MRSEIAELQVLKATKECSTPNSGYTRPYARTPETNVAVQVSIKVASSLTSGHPLKLGGTLVGPSSLLVIPRVSSDGTV